MDYPISNWNSSGSYDLPRYRSYLPLEMFCVPILVFPASLSSPKVYWHCLIPRWYTVKFYDKSTNLWVTRIDHL